MGTDQVSTLSLEQDYLRRILTAPVYDVAERTPLTPAVALSERLGQEVLLKREDLQPIFSFKLRGAYNRMAQAPHCPVIAASAGNHAQGVALAAQRLGRQATIVMPCTTPQIKVDAVRRRGAEAVLFGDDYDAAHGHAVELQNKTNALFVHPFDDPDVIAGQGTIGLEVLQQSAPAPDALFIPVGGGGLLAGMAAYVKAVNPAIKVIGVECEDSACMAAAIGAGRPVALQEVGIFADGVAVRQAGQHTYAVARQCVDDIITVSVDQICAAIKDIFEDTRTLAEPAGALATAGLKKYAETATGHQRLIAIQSGANVNFGRLSHVVERAELGEGHEALLAVHIAERPGSFLAFCRQLGHHAVSEFNYRYADDAAAEVFVGLRFDDAEQKQSVLQRLHEAGNEVLDLSHNELAKLHLRHMVGGRAAGLRGEVIYRFEFPERPGALLEFLAKLAGRWNISLFHYRNHGAAFGRVLAGFEVPPAERGQFNEFLDRLGLNWTEETDNPAYARFLSGIRSMPELVVAN